MSDTDGKLEIERKFVLSSPPLHALKCGREIRQGYLSARGAETEVRIRSVGRQRFMTVKTGAGLVRREEELRISRTMFESLWPFTNGARITKTRYTTSHHGREIEIDVFHETLDSLILAEVEIESGAGAAGLDLPDWLGTEVTGLPGFSNSRLAYDGIPYDIEVHRPASTGAPLRPITHAGAIPYRTVGGELQVLCITSKSGKRWIVPKGQWDDGYDLRETAAMEAWEEAGVVGTLGKEAVGVFEDDRSGRDTRVLVYPLRIEEERDIWPEHGDREREWLDIPTAVERVAFDALSDLIGDLGHRLG